MFYFNDSFVKFINNSLENKHINAINFNLIKKKEN